MTCSSNDFTLRILQLPPPEEGNAPDLDRLRHSLRRHIEAIVSKEPHIIMDRPVQIIDINFGLNNQGLIKVRFCLTSCSCLVKKHTSFS